jgi:hypothetical protein
MGSPIFFAKTYDAAPDLGRHPRKERGLPRWNEVSCVSERVLIPVFCGHSSTTAGFRKIEYYKIEIFFSHEMVRTMIPRPRGSSAAASFTKAKGPAPKGWSLELAPAAGLEPAT